MKTRIHHTGCPQEYLAAYGLDPGRVIYFDIETTGFRASTSRLYMIGWAVREDSSCPSSPDIRNLNDDCQGWVVTQIMAESSAEEVLLLEQFSRILSLYDTIIEFNGDRFDLPYMKEKYESFHMKDPFAHCQTVDLYRVIKPYKNMLGMSRLNQKSVEQFLHITRKDPYNGGELINVYRSVRSHSCSDEAAAVSALFLHNYEDVLGMLKMTPLLAYPLAMQSRAQVTISRKEACSLTYGCGVLEASFTLDVPVPHSLDLTVGAHLEENLQTDQMEDLLRAVDDNPCHKAPDAACRILLEKDQATVTLYLLPLSLYHYFPDYRNYYYLPEEDTAIHKSVATFVDASHREKAKAQNCYVKKQGFFLPQAEDQFQPSFRRCYKDSISWFEYQSGMEEDSGSICDYIHALVRCGSSSGHE